MSFETYIGKNAAFKVTNLYMKTKGAGTVPLSHVAIQMQVNGPNTCVVEPCFGRDGLNNKTVNPSFLEKLTPGDTCSVFMTVKKSGSIGAAEPLLFQGRVIGSELRVNNNPLGSSAGISISLRHLPESDLMGVSIGQRSYYKAGAEMKIFRIDKKISTHSIDTNFINNSLLEKKVAVYLKDLCTALVDWYMGDNKSIDISAILKAIPCVVKPEVARLIEQATGENSPQNIAQAFSKAVKTTFDGAIASKATLMSVLSTLSTFGMLSLVPLLKSIVITPTLEISQWTKDTGIYLDRKWIQGISNPSTPLRFPVERVSLNRKFAALYGSQDVRLWSPSKLFSQNTRYAYPETGEGSVLLVDPPPILTGLVNCCAHVRSEGTTPKPIDKGGSKDTNQNSVGSKPLEVNDVVFSDLARRATRLMWSKLAYVHHSSNISVIPHWVFGDSYSSDIHATYDKYSVWSAINKNIKFKMPFTSVGYGDSDHDITYVGYVKGMSMDISVEHASVATTLNVTNVRTAYEDQQFALPIDANPLYDNTTANPV